MNDFYLKEYGVQKLRAWLELLKVRMDNGYINTVEYCCASLFVISLHLSYSVRLNRLEQFFREKKGHISKKPKSDVPAKKKDPNANQNYSLKRRLSEILVYFTAM